MSLRCWLAVGNGLQVSVSKDAAAHQKTKKRRSPQQGKAAGRKKGRAKADEVRDTARHSSFPPNG